MDEYPYTAQDMRYAQASGIGSAGVDALYDMIQQTMTHPAMTQGLRAELTRASDYAHDLSLRIASLMSRPESTPLEPLPPGTREPACAVCGWDNRCTMRHHDYVVYNTRHPVHQFTPTA